MVFESILNLNSAVKNGQKQLFISLIKLVFSSIKKMLHCCGISSFTVQETFSFKLSKNQNVSEQMKSKYATLLVSLGKMAVAAHVASLIWPPPDANINLRNLMVDVLSNVRHFTSAAQKISTLRPFFQIITTEKQFESCLTPVFNLESKSTSLIANLASLVALITKERKLSYSVEQIYKQTSTQVSEFLILVNELDVSQLDFLTERDKLLVYCGELILETTNLDWFSKLRLDEIAHYAKVVSDQVEIVVQTVKVIVDQEMVRECMLLSTAMKDLELEIEKIDVDLNEEIMLESEFPTLNTHDVINEITFNDLGEVTGGTLHALIVRLTMHDTPVDSDFLESFLLNFRQFTNQHNVCALLIRRFDKKFDPQHQAPVRLRIINFFKTWLEGKFFFPQDQQVLDEISEFSMEKIAPLFPQASKKLTDLVLKRKSDVGFVKPIVDFESLLNLEDVDVLDMANQLTLLDYQLFCEIQPRDLVQISELGAPLKNAILFSNQLSMWVTDLILVDGEKKRAQMLKYWIKTSNLLLDLNNLSSLRTIMGALDSTPICRLSKTWSLVSAKTKLMFDGLRVITDSQRNFIGYRHKLKSVTGPCIPFLGIVLSDLKFIEDGNKDTRAEGRLINFDKCMKKFKVVQEFIRFKECFELKQKKDIQSFILKNLKVPRTPTEFYSKSNQLEPK